MILLTAAMLACTTKLVNLTKFQWNDFDYSSLKTAKFRCAKIYYNAPCLKKFIKIRKQDYNAICGK